MSVLVLRQRESLHRALGVVTEPDAVDAVRARQLVRADDGRLVVAPDDRAVDRALHLVALHREGDLLRHRLAHTSRFMDRRVRLAAPVETEGRVAAEAAHDEPAVAV